MQVLAMLSVRPGSGQITVLVNLASGLVRQGKRVLIGQLGASLKLLDWLGVAVAGDSGDSDLAGTLASAANQIRSARFGLDLLNIPLSPAGQNSLETLQPVLAQLGYNYLILNFTLPEAGAFVPPQARLLVCTDLQGENEAAEIQKLQHKLQSNNQISLIIPNRINPKEWVHNNEQLSALGEHFGYEKLVDPLPT